jgi:hypothetical protein
VRPARHSEARRQPARHSRRAQHVFVVTKQASTVKTKPGWPRAVVIHVKVPRKIADFAAWSWCRGLGARGVAFKPFINHVLYFLIL